MLPRPSIWHPALTIAVSLAAGCHDVWWLGAAGSAQHWDQWSTAGDNNPNQLMKYVFQHQP